MCKLKRTRSLLPLLIALTIVTASPSLAQTYTPLQVGEGLDLKTISAAIAFGLSALGAGLAIGRAGSAGLAASAERPELRTLAIIITALGEALAIYGIVVAILILGA